jgi:hypothetical protein
MFESVPVIGVVPPAAVYEILEAVTAVTVYIPPLPILPVPFVA